MGGDDVETKVKPDANQMENSTDQGAGTPVNHIKSQIKVCIMTDIVKIPRDEIPPELYQILRIQQGQTAKRKTYLPLVYVDELSQRIRDLVVINSTDKSAVV